MRLDLARSLGVFLVLNDFPPMDHMGQILVGYSSRILRVEPSKIHGTEMVTETEEAKKHSEEGIWETV